MEKPSTQCDFYTMDGTAPPLEVWGCHGSDVAPLHSQAVNHLGLVLSNTLQTLACACLCQASSSTGLGDNLGALHHPHPCCSMLTSGCGLAAWLPASPWDTDLPHRSWPHSTMC